MTVAVLALALAVPFGPGQPAQAAQACGPVVTDPLAEPPWALTRLRPDLAWPLSMGAGITVAVIDSGVSPDHAALRGKVLPGKDFVAAGTGECDENGHGTLIAGIIAARETASNGIRFYGVAPGANVIPVRVLQDQRRTFEEDLPKRIAEAIVWAVDVGGAHVINLSLTTLPSPELDAAIQYGQSKGVVMVAAAGNEGAATQPGAPVYPASYDGVIAVAAVDKEDNHVGTSTAGAYVDVAAPGVRIAGPATAGGGFLFSEQGGTSFAAAYVSGVAALIRAYDPSLTPKQVAQRITETADHPADMWNPLVGSGVVNPQRAVGAVRSDDAADAVAPASRMDVQPPPRDPLRTVTLIASWTAGTGAALALVALIVTAAVRQGRKRGWRPARRA